MATTKKFGIVPLADRVVVKPAEGGVEKRLPSGIIIPETADKEKPMEGEVVAVGSGRYDDGKVVPMAVKVGDRVLFGKYSHEEVKIAGEKYYILAESNILAIIK